MDDQEFVRNQQQEAIANDPNAMYADAIREEKAINILAQIDPGNLLTDIEHRIRGEKKDMYGQWSKISRSNGEVSEELVSDFISFLGSILNQNTSMSNFKEQEVTNMMEMIIDWVRTNLVVNAENYGIEGNYPEYDRVAHIICSTCFTVFKRALNGAESRKIFRMMKMNETINPSKENKFTDNFKFW
ncbi:hypothetical protein LCGC14_1454480 [marine sediment metagenome]|uniref:Uncharacterized protein n=1 Tax=marine sediment metagenome TaxID=412755 RepID=A0A0F9MIR4_9ZZZZ